MQRSNRRDWIVHATVTASDTQKAGCMTWLATSFGFPERIGEVSEQIDPKREYLTALTLRALGGASLWATNLDGSGSEPGRQSSTGGSQFQRGLAGRRAGLSGTAAFE